MEDQTAHKNRHITSKILLGILAAFLLFLAVFFAVDYSHYLKDKSPYRTLFVPRLELSLLQIDALSADKTDLTMKVLVHNPLPFNLRADSLHYKVYISGVEVIKSMYPQSINIRRWDSSWVSLPVTAYNDKLLTVLDNAEKQGKDSLEYEVQAYFGTQLLGHRDFNMDIKTLQPTVYIPKLKITKIEYDSLNGEGVTLFISTLIYNRNKMAFKLKDLTYRVAIADDAWIKGTKSGVITIDSAGTSPLTVPLRISFKQIGKSLGPLIRKGKNTPFKLEATFKLVSDDNAMKNSQVIVKDQTVVHEIVQLVKDEVKKGKEKDAQKSDEQKKEEKQEKKENKIHFGKKHVGDKK